MTGDKVIQPPEGEPTVLPASFFAANRQALLEALGESALVLLAAGRAPHKTADENYPHFTNRNFFYLCGIEQEGVLLLLYKSGGQTREILFVQPTDAMYERWHGHMVKPDEATARSGLTEIQYIDRFEETAANLAIQQDLPIWLDFSARSEQAANLKTWLADKWPEREAQDLTPFLIQLRIIKSGLEVNQMRRAIRLTDNGIRAMLSRLAQREPGLMEYHLWSAFAAALAEEGCLATAFASIVASGKNLFCLHYMTPYAPIGPDDLIQIDVGAVADGVCADISRAFPANGRFTPLQRSVYEMVRHCQETAFRTIRPGISLKEVNEQCRLTAQKELTAAGIMKEGEAIADYFWHSVSHHLGFDVHDTGSRESILRPGMVVTVEPGIYIPALNVGMRLEDDVLVTEDGCLNLSQDIPREAEEIEALMAGWAAR
jgi:Xaa-Pro aminopeptidase